MSNGIDWGRMNDCLILHTTVRLLIVTETWLWCVCIYICTSNICIIVHTSLWKNTPECWKIISILEYLTRWKLFTLVTSLLLLPQCVILCALLGGSFAFLQVIFICSYSLPLSCFSPSTMPSNLFVCLILHCTSCKIYRYIVGICKVLDILLKILWFIGLRWSLILSCLIFFAG
jgi:hypothetical protein